MRTYACTKYKIIFETFECDLIVIIQNKRRTMSFTKLKFFS